eukprot:8342754-Pyramimonas_sp.AAC.1
MHVVGGDWNLDPHLVDSTGLPRRVEGAFFVPAQKTCLPPGSLTTIDYFLASTCFARARDK